MTTNRREFLEHLGTTAMLGALPISAMPAALREFAPPPATAADDFDFTWTTKLKGKAHKAVFDCAEVESGYGVWRASLWVKQYMETLKAGPRDCTPVLVLRHNGIALAMKQSFWDKYSVAKDKNVMHPITQQGTDRNPALLSSTRNEVPADFDEVALDRYVARGNIALACNLAFA